MNAQKKIIGTSIAAVTLGVVASMLMAAGAPSATVSSRVGTAAPGGAKGGSAASTLWGIYGEHSMHDCPVNNRETAKEVIAASEMDLGPLMAKYGVTAVRDRYHSGLEHTFLWVVETTQPHDLEEFSIELGIARWNNLRFVPLRTFEEGVVPAVRVLHGLEDWHPSN